ncbi:MAG: hypothetical protein KatS3mg130_0136 [Candidatus Sumerlaea sp.]|nr:MAG: hypothetical protein KatS3mg130_0136 [Candidatus Sumerlaea sp.]
MRFRLVERSARSGEVERVRTLVANKRYSDAIRLCEQLLASGLDDNETSAVRRLKAEAHFGRAHEELDRMNLLGADAELRKAVEAYEPFYRAHLLLGERLLQSVVTQKEGVEEILKGLKYGEAEISEGGACEIPLHGGSGTVPAGEVPRGCFPIL